MTKREPPPVVLIRGTLLTGVQVAELLRCIQVARDTDARYQESSEVWGRREARIRLQNSLTALLKG